MQLSELSLFSYVIISHQLLDETDILDFEQTVMRQQTLLED